MIKGYGEKIENLYKNIRQTNLNELIKRRDYIKKIHPEILDIEKNIATIYLNMIKCKNKSSINELKLKISSLRSKKNNMLISINLPENYLDNIYDCKNCKDTGYILNKKCSCFFKNLSYLYLNDSELKILIQENNFENFDFNFYSKNHIGNHSTTPDENIKNIYKNILNYIKTFESTNTNLLFKGECGSGKTFLSHCIAKELLEKGYLVIYKTSEDLFNELNNYYSFKNIDNSNKIDDSILMQCDLLIIDDLGTETPNNFYYSYFFNFLNKKIILNKKLLISTNFTLEYLQKNYTDRILSRILGDFLIFNFFVDQEIRIQKKIKNKRVF